MVLGLTLASSHLEDPAVTGHSVGAAFLATLWGSGTANGLHLPIANALERSSALAVQHRRSLVEGLVALQAGAIPRALREAVEGLLAPSDRETTVEARPSAQGRAA